MTWLALGLLVSGAVNEAREAPRLRGAIGLAGGVGYSFREPALGFAPGVTFDVGATFNDRQAVVFRGVLTSIVVSNLISLGVSFETLVGEHLGLSLGGALALIGGGPDQAGAFAATVPVRLSYLFASRPDDQLARRGFALFFELAPGVTFAGGQGRGGSRTFGPPFAATAALGLSYVWW